MKNLIIILLLAGTSLGCSDLFINPNKHDFYCKIDGKKFVPERDRRIPGQVGSSPLTFEFPKEGFEILGIRARNSPTQVSIVLLLKKEIIEKGTFDLSDQVGLSSYASYTYNTNLNDTKSYSKSGQVKIIDVNSTGFTGEFEFTTYNEYLGKEVKITNGKFKTRNYKP